MFSVVTRSSVRSLFLVNSDKEMKRETIRSFFKYLRLFMSAALMASTSTVRGQTLLDENFSSGFEGWTVGASTGSLQWIDAVGGWCRWRDAV